MGSVKRSVGSILAVSMPKIIKEELIKNGPVIGGSGGENTSARARAAVCKSPTPQKLSLGHFGSNRSAQESSIARTLDFITNLALACIACQQTTNSRTHARLARKVRAFAPPHPHTHTHRIASSPVTYALCSPGNAPSRAGFACSLLLIPAG